MNTISIDFGIAQFTEVLDRLLQIDTDTSDETMHGRATLISAYESMLRARREWLRVIDRALEKQRNQLLAQVEAADRARQRQVEHTNIVRAEYQRRLNEMTVENVRLRGERDRWDDEHRAVCARLRDAVVRHKLGVGGEPVDQLVVEALDAAMLEWTCTTCGFTYKGIDLCYHEESEDHHGEPPCPRPIIEYVTRQQRSTTDGAA